MIRSDISKERNLVEQISMIKDRKKRRSKTKSSKRDVQIFCARLAIGAHSPLKEAVLSQLAFQPTLDQGSLHTCLNGYPPVNDPDPGTRSFLRCS